MKIMEKRFVKTMDFLQLNVLPFPAVTGMMGNVGLVWARIHVKVRKTTHKIPPILYYRIYIKIRVILSVCPLCPCFNPLPINQFKSQVYLWIPVNMAEILRPGICGKHFLSFPQKTL